MDCQRHRLRSGLQARWVLRGQHSCRREDAIAKNLARALAHNVKKAIRRIHDYTHWVLPRRSGRRSDWKQCRIVQIRLIADPTDHRAHLESIQRPGRIPCSTNIYKHSTIIILRRHVRVDRLHRRWVDCRCGIRRTDFLGQGAIGTNAIHTQRIVIMVTGKILVARHKEKFFGRRTNRNG